MLAAFLVTLATATTPWPVLQQQILDIMQNATQTMAQQGGNYALQSALIMEQGSVSVSAGFNDLYPTKPNPMPSMVGDGFLLGSITKMATSSAVMRLVESGQVQLDDPIASLIDSYIYALNKTTLFALWNDSRIQVVTVKQLLGMTSGIMDFDTYQLREFQEQVDPHYDITPFDILHKVNKTFLFYPNANASYSSTNYELLGLLLACKANASNWDTYDQAAILTRRPGAEYGNFTFALHGTLGSYNRSNWSISHGYDAFEQKSDVLWNVSATSGWACGNILSSVHDISQFTYDLFGPEKRMVSADTLLTMYNNPRELIDIPGCMYGLGTMAVTQPQNPNGWMIGHLGDTYGFVSCTAYNLNFSYSLTVATNVESSKEALPLLHEISAALSGLLEPNA
ncbi:hypothetical protein DIPPA_18673 [Diplonema papillatum]|nr:hypothetical protein DIPPA_18673 [Diplonema papillatum]